MNAVAAHILKYLIIAAMFGLACQVDHIHPPMWLSISFWLVAFNMEWNWKAWTVKQLRVIQQDIQDNKNALKAQIDGKSHQGNRG